MEPIESQSAARQALEAALAKATAGGTSSMDVLLQLVYGELREMAQARLRHEPAGITLQTTALVHEAYLKLLPRREGVWAGREHFLAAAGEAMRRILVDHARGRHRLKRGGELVRVELNDAAMMRDDRELIELDDALQRLQAIDPVGAHVVTLKMFSGMTEAEIAAATAISERTVRRHWVFARAWLARELRGEAGLGSEGAP
ncbi:MAG TPA: ECF-type sigma factor [Phycisphaerales bacterium]|nr:ECF-type sigma factor [Phycisphaerales bacterium]